MSSSSRTWFSLLLLSMSIVTAYSGSHSALAAMTTYTTFSTFTTTAGQTLFSSVVIGTSYTTLTTHDTIYDGTFEMDAPGPNYCSLRTISFAGQKGQVVKVQLQATNAIYFFAMTEESYQKWREQRFCRVRTPTLIKQEEIRSYSGQVTLAIDGEYRFLFELWDTSEPASVQFSATLEPVIQTISRTLYSGTIQTRRWTSTVTRSAVLAQVVQEPTPTPPPQTNLLIIVVVAIAGVAIGFFVIRTRRKKGSVEPVSVKTEKFCIKCGTELLPNAKFCRRCGEPAWTA